MLCYRHPKTETAVMCGKCERPICVKCMVSGPAGMRCPACASLRGTHLYKTGPHHLLYLVVIGVVTGAVGVSVIKSIGWFFMIFLSTAFGGAIGELMLRAIGRKHGPAVEWTGSISLLVGGLIPLAYDVYVYRSFIILQYDWVSLLALGIATVACYSRLKY